MLIGHMPHIYATASLETQSNNFFFFINNKIVLIKNPKHDTKHLGNVKPNYASLSSTKTYKEGI